MITTLAVLLFAQGGWTNDRVIYAPVPDLPAQAPPINPRFNTAMEPAPVGAPVVVVPASYRTVVKSRTVQSSAPVVMRCQGGQCELVEIPSEPVVQWTEPAYRSEVYFQEPVYTRQPMRWGRARGFRSFRSCGPGGCN